MCCNALRHSRRVKEDTIKMSPTLAATNRGKSSGGGKSSFRNLISEMIPNAMKRRTSRGFRQLHALEDSDSAGHQALAARFLSWELPALEQFHGDALPPQQNG
jgi:hypothetical protein